MEPVTDSSEVWILIEDTKTGYRYSSRSRTIYSENGDLYVRRDDNDKLRLVRAAQKIEDWDVWGPRNREVDGFCLGVVSREDFENTWRIAIVHLKRRYESEVSK